MVSVNRFLKCPCRRLDRRIFIHSFLVMIYDVNLRYLPFSLIHVPHRAFTETQTNCYIVCGCNEVPLEAHEFELFTVPLLAFVVI